MVAYPRRESFYRYKPGEDLPFLGVYASYNPVVSAIAGVAPRQAVAIGPTLGLAELPDQVMFGLINEFIQDFSGNWQYSISFQLAFPFLFR